MCLICREEDKIALKGLRNRLKDTDCVSEKRYSRTEKGALALAAEWGFTIHRYAIGRPAEQTAKHFGLEVETVKRVLYG